MEFESPKIMHGTATIRIERPLLVEEPRERRNELAFLFALSGNALGAYAIGPIPIPWLAQCVPIISVLLLTLAGCPTVRVPGMAIAAIFLGWALTCTLVQTVGHDYARLMPARSTTPYPLYVALRFLNLIAAMAQAYLTYWLLVHGKRKQIAGAITRVAVCVAVAAIYLYLAQSYGWWEPPRTRIGTDGDTQATTYSYAFHRATGTFREPSHLAEWLMAPFLLSLQVRGWRNSWLPLVLGSTLLLTGSLTGILGVAFGLGLAAIITNPARLLHFPSLLRIAAIVAAISLSFSLIVVANSDGHGDLLQVVAERIEPLLSEGMAGSNRADVYEYVASETIPALGNGYGHANLLFTEYLGLDLVAAMLSLYLSTAFSLGYPGLLLLTLVLLQPILLFVRNPSRSSPRLWILAAYFSWIVSFAVHSEEFTAMFATVYAIACYDAQPRDFHRASAA